MNRLDGYGPKMERPGFHVGTKILMGVILLSMVTFGVLSFIGGQDAMFIYTWVQLGLPFITIVLVLALIIPGARRIAKGPRVKMVLTVVTCMIVAMAGLLVYSFLYTYTLVSPNPHSYHASPNGENQIVVMTYNDPETLTEENQRIEIVAYPMKNRFFFYDTDVTPLRDDKMAYPSYAVEWLSDQEARVYLTSFSGEGVGETIVNMNDRRTITGPEDTDTTTGG